MGIYSNNYDNETYELQHPNQLLEAFIYDEIVGQSDSVKKAFLESEECAVLEAKKLISRKTIVRLNKNDDLTRRTGMAALQLAKDNNDSLWKKLVKNRIQERKLLAAIKKKYANKAQIAARQGQRLYVSGQGTKPVNTHKLQPKEMSKTRH